MVQAGEFLAARRRARGLTQATLADRIGVHRHTARNWESATRAVPPPAIFHRLCAALEIEPAELLTELGYLEPAAGEAA